jgi:serine/threonine protein kinase
MNPDQTHPQNPNDQRHAKQLSLASSALPEIPGYQPLRLLGQGAYGRVWLAVDLNTRRPVAIKQFLHGNRQDLEALGREIQLLAKMSAGRNIVQVLKVGWDQSPPFYVMEYMENGSLEDWLQQDREISVKEVVRLIREIAEGLSFAHGKGILHCDLKPANVLLDHSKQARLADFGQARLAGDQSSSLGTLFYMSPDQADLQSTPDATWDVYSLGAVAYRLLVGQPPYRSEQSVESLKSAKTVPEQLCAYRRLILESRRPRLHHQRRGVDKQLSQIVDRCLSANASDRFQNAEQVLGALDSRDQSRTRRPLYLVGLVGPVLLLLLMLMFSSRSRNVAVEQSEQSVVQRAMESNRFAAQYAARTLEAELVNLFRVVEDESQREELRSHMLVCREAVSRDLSLQSNQADRASEIEKLRQLEERLQLERYLQRRIDVLAVRRGPAASLVNSLFVNEGSGVNWGIVFADPEEGKSANSPVGLNFAYRSYFTGERTDGMLDEPSERYQPTRATSLSASFRSTSTGAWKIAISAPIWPPEQADSDGDQAESSLPPLGVLVLTVNLGDFRLLAQASGQGVEPSRFAALFEGRQGNQRGTLLQHPYISQADRAKMKSMRIPQIPQPVIDQLVAGDLASYTDPASELVGGQVYAGRWIASIAQVELPSVGQITVDPGRKKSDLWILVQERYSSVSSPLQSLAGQLRKETLLQLATLLMVVLLLWYFVLRLSRG